MMKIDFSESLKELDLIYPLFEAFQCDVVMPSRCEEKDALWW
jgi:hypothetical protein